MNILLTNDDGFDAPGLVAAYQAACQLGQVFVVAPQSERSACSHMITLRRPITVETRQHERFGKGFAVDGTPADCVRLGVSELIPEPIDLVLSGINRGANSGVDVFYSGTVAGAREGAILGITSIAVSQAIRGEFAVDWPAATKVVRAILPDLIAEALPAAGFWSLNLPLPIPANGLESLRRVPISVEPTPMTFDRLHAEGDPIMKFGYGAPYWSRHVGEATDFSTIRDGLISLSAIPLNGQF